MASHRSARRRDRRRSRLEELERRVLLSAETPVVPLVQEPLADSANDAGTLVAPAAGNAPAATAVAVSRHELAIVDTSTPDYQTLVDDLLKSNDGSRQIDILLLDPSRDGFQQISEALNGRSDLAAIHLISHGSAGNVQLGGSTLNADTLLLHANEVARWGDSLGQDGDILIYGCDVASTADGQQFVDALGQLTGADVAASDDRTGAATLGGDWQLEYEKGSVEANTALDATSAADWNGVLAITSNGTVTSTSTNFAPSLTWSHTVGSGSDRVLVVQLAIDQFATSAASVTYGGIPLTQIGRGAGLHSVEIWALVDPPVGTNNVVANFSGWTAAAGGATTFNGVDQTNPFGTFSSNGGYGVVASVTVASAVGDRVIDVQYWEGNPLGGAAGANQTVNWSRTGSFMVGSSTIEDGASLVTMSGSYSSFAEWQIGAVSMQAAAGVTVTPTSGLTTTEAGGQASFSVVLDAAPTATVTIPVSVSNSLEGTVSTSTLTFTTANWNVAQTVTVTGADDTLDDADRGYTVVLGAASSTDGSYSGLNPSDVTLTNTDDDTTNTIVVTTTADDATANDGDTSSLYALMQNRGTDGKISLREAIIAANNTANGAGGADRISFNIPDALVGGVHTITLSSVLPTITDSVIINGASEPDWATSSRPVVAINGGTTIADGLRLWGSASGGSTVRGLILQNFATAGISIAGSNGNTIAGNWIGLNAAGTGAAGNQGGVVVWNSANNIIGGSTAADRNVISGNTVAGVVLDTDDGSTTGNQIKGNYIGTNAAGTSAVGNGAQGVWVNAAGNTIGGTGANEGNVISGTTSWVGIQLEAPASNTTVAGNLIGLNAAGTAALANAGGGLYIQSGSNTIGGITANARNVISGNGGAGITITGASAANNVVMGNYVGTNAAGTGDITGTGKTADRSGIILESGASNNRIGTNADGVNDSAERNIISGNNWYGIDIVDSGTSGNVVQGNYIGTDVTGLVALGNSMGGVSLWDGVTNNRVGGGATGAGNVIAGNETGVLVANGVSGNKVQGNYIGIGADGSTLVANTGAGVYFYNGGTTAAVTNNTIGTDGDGTNDAGERNVISGNVTGIALKDAEVTGNTIAGNYIGTDASGTLNRGNSASGILIYNGASSNVIGGTTASKANVIAYNGAGSANDDGITVSDSNSTGNVFLRNSIFSNAGLGIDLGNDGVTANDTGDGDTGPNNLQNTAALTRAVLNGTSLTISGTLSAAANTDYRFEIYSSASADPSGSGEGQTFLNTVNLSVGATGTLSFSINFSDASLAIGQYISVTVTRSNATYSTLYETSEFSNAVAVAAPDSPPVGQDSAITINEDTTYTFTAADFPFTDADGNSLRRIWIQSLPDSGTLLRNGVPVAAFNAITAADINAGLLTYQPAANSNGTALTSFSYAIEDNGSVFGGGATLDLSPSTLTINITAVNDQPTLSNLGNTVSHTEGGASVVLAATATAADAELSASNNFNGATLTLARNGGANPTDALAFDGVNVTNSGAGVYVGGVQVGTYTFSGGQLDITFNGNATNARVDTLLQNIVYWNTSDAPPSSVQIDWTLRDGNTGAQGSGGALSTTGSTTVNIAATNDAPIFSSSAVTTATEDSAYSYGITTSDTDGGDTLTITAPTLPAWLTLTDHGNGTATLSGTPTNAEVGTHSVVLQVSDGTVSVTQSFTITVTNTNDAPTFTSSAVTTATEDSAYSYSITTSDVDAGAVLTITAPTLPAWLTLTDHGNGTATLSGTPTNAEVGTYSVVLQVSDGTVTTSQSFTISVSNQNDIPTDIVATRYLSDQSYLTMSNIYTLDLDKDHGGGQLMLDGVAYAKGLATHPFGGGAASSYGYLDYAINGATRFKATIGINDGTGGTGSTRFYVYVDNVLRYASGTMTSDSAPINLDIDTSGGAVLRIAVDNANDTNVFDHAIWANARLEGGTVALGSIPENAANGTVVGSVVGSDIDTNDNWTYQLTDDAGGRFAINSTTGQITVANGSLIDHEAAATHSITVKATDTGGLWTTRTFAVSNTDVNEPPSFTSTAVTTAAEDSAYSYSITTSDVDAGAVLTITAPTLPAWLTLTDHGNGTATLSGTPTNAEVGTYSVVLQVSDGALSATHSFTITVTNTNDAPVLDNSGTMTLSPIARTNTTGNGNTVAQVIASAGGDRITDVDGGAVEGIAVTGSTTVGGGHWEYSLDGGSSWAAVGSVADSSALLLRPTDRLRFVPDGTTTGSASLTLRAWDQSAGTAGSKVSATSNGGVTAFSSASESATLDVVDSTDLPTAVDDSAQTQTAAAVTIDVVANDIDPQGHPLNVLDASNGAHGDVSISGGSVTYTPDAGYSGDDSFQYIVTDGNQGLTHYWRLDGEGTDVVGGANGTLMNGPTTIDSLSLGALQFDGVNDYVDLPDITYGSEFSLAFYFQIGDNSGNQVQYLYSHGAIPNAGVANTIQVGVVEASHATLAQRNNLITTVWDGNDTASGQLLVDISTLIGDGQWHLYTMTVTPGIGTNVYVDGVLRGNIARGGDPIDPTGHAYIGARSDLDPTRFLNAGNAVDGLSIYGRSLSDGEVSDLWSNAANVGTTSVHVNAPPVVTTSGGTVTFTENGAAVAVDSGVTLSDANDTNLTGATIRISGNYSSGNDVLSFTNQLGISGSWDASTGTLTLSGTASVANYQTAIRTITFSNGSESPSTALRTISLTVTDGKHPSATATCTVNVVAQNDQPTAANPIADQSANEDAAFSFQFASNTFADVDAGDSLTYSASGLPAWLSFNAATRTFSGTPANADVGTVTITVRATDGSGAYVEDTFDIVVANTNDAPALDGTRSPMLAAQNEDSGAPVGAVGTLVSSLVDFASPSGQVDNVTDPDAGALRGIAITAADTTNGSWWYSTDGGGSWNAFGTVSDNTALLLAADGNTRIYFQPNANYNGAQSAAITFRAWDRSSGSAGTKVDLSAPIWLDQFNSASYSGSNGTASWSGNWVETDNNGGGASGGLIRVTGGRLQVGSDSPGDNVYRTVNLSGQASATLSFDFTNNITGGATDRISVQVSADGGATYTTLGSFDHTLNTGSGSASYDISAYASNQTRIRFVVSINDQGNTVLFDNVQITGSAAVGGSTAFSANTDTASLTVNAVNDQPTLSNLGNTVSHTEGGSSVVLAASATVADAELSASNNFNGSTLTLQRNGGANSTDALAFDGVNVTTSGANVYVGGVQVGTYTVSGGRLDVAFNGSATQARVNTLLQNIVYWTTSDAPPSSVQIDWTFSDGNAGAQGAGGALSAAGSTTVNITATNDAPAFTSSAVTAATEDSAYSYSITTSDVDVGDTLTITAPTLPAWLTLTDNGDGTATLTGTPTNADVGTHSVVLQLSDGTATVTQSFTITVANTNDTPTVANPIADQSATEDAAFSFQFAANTFADVDAGDSLTYTASGVPAWLNFNTATRTFSGTPANADVGTATITVRATDGSGAWTEDTFDLTVANTNDAPSFTSSAVTAATEDSAYSYSITTSDVDAGDTLTITAPTLPAWLTLTDNGDGTATLTGTPSNADVGTHSVVLQLSDGTAIVTQSFTITVANTNDAPAFTSSAVTAATEDSAYSYSITTSDVDVGDTLTITAPTLPAWLTLTDNGDGTATLTGTPTNADVGTHSVVLQLSDGTATVTQSFTITVANTNDTPTVANPIADQSATEDAAFSFQFAANTFADVDAGDSLTYTASGLPGWLSFDAATRTFSGTPANADVGTVTITVRATDGSGAYVEDTFDLTVANTNDAPTLTNPIVDQSAGSDSQFSFQFAANTFDDVDSGDTITYTTSALPAWLTFNAATRTFTGTPTYADIGTVSITVTATDGVGASVSDTFTITVMNTNIGPTLARNLVLSVGAGATSVIDSGTLLAADVDNTPAQITYTLLSTPLHGELLRAGIGLIAGDTFSQADIDGGRLVYVHDGADATSDSFLFSISDGEGGSIGTSRFAISIVRDTGGTPIGDNGNGGGGGTGTGGGGSGGPVPGVDPPSGKARNDDDSDSQQDREAPVPPAATGSTASDEQPLAPASVDEDVGADLGSVEADRGDRGGTRAVSMSLINAERTGKSKGGIVASQASTADESALPTGLDAALNSLKEQLKENLRDAKGGPDAAEIAAATASVAASAGYLTWLLRGGSLFASVLASMPAWRTIDPLPVLARRRDDSRGLLATRQDDDTEEDDDEYGALLDPRSGGGS